MSAPTAPSSFDRLLQSIRSIVRAELPTLTFSGIYEYSIQSSNGNTVNCDPIDTTIPLPSLPNVELRPSILGESVSSPPRASRCLVAFVNSDPTRPVILSIDTPPSSAAITAGSQVATDHVATIEGTALLIYNVLVSFFAAFGATSFPTLASPAIMAGAQPLILAAVNAALAAQSAPAPIGLAAQIAAAVPYATSMPLGTNPSPCLGPIAINTSTKTPNVSGLFPSVGAASVKTG